MGQKLNKFQMYEPKYFAGQVSDLFFAELTEQRPYLAQKTMEEIISTNVGSFSSYLKGLSTLQIPDHTDEYMWNIIGSSYRNIPLVAAKVGSNLVTAATVNVGAGGTPFQLIFAEKWFAKEEILVGEKGERYRIKITDEPEYDGTLVVYNCRVTGENHTYGIPGKELVGGKKFAYEYYTVETEGHGPGGTVRFSSTAAVKNHLSMIRKDYTVYGREFGRNMITPIVFKDDAGNKKEFNMGMPMIQWKYEQEFEQEFNRMLIYGRDNRDEAGNYHDYGQSGNMVKMGAGLFEQKDCGHVIYYDKFSIKFIEDALFQLAVNTLPLNERVFVLRTGSRGAAQFSNAASDRLSTWNFGGSSINASNPATIQKVSSELHTNAFAVGGQIVEYRGMNNVILRIEVDSSYDDDRRHMIMKGGNEMNGPAFSYRYDIDWIGGATNQNIQLVQVKGWEMGDFSHYGSGFRNPWTGKQGPGGNGNDSYSYGRIRKGGVLVKDPTKTVTILPIELAY